MSTVTASELQIIHSPDESKFYCVIENADDRLDDRTDINSDVNADINAELLYTLEGNSIDFYRTFVPPEARGSKVAYRLVEQGITWAEEQDFDISASCWYVQKYLDRKASNHSKAHNG